MDYTPSTKALLGLPTNVVVVGGAVVVGVLVVGEAELLVVGAAVLVVGAAVLVVGGTMLVVGTPVVVVLEVVVPGGCVVVDPSHTNAPPGDPWHESQQLAAAPTQVTPLSASHSSALA